MHLQGRACDNPAMNKPRKRVAPSAPKRKRVKVTAHRFGPLAAALADIGKSFYQRGWVLGTSGNLSAVVSERPLRLAITPTGLDKGALNPSQFLEIDETARVLRGSGKPSAETGLHLAIVRARGAGAVLHTHSLWSTLLSDTFATQGAVPLEGFEMLKGLYGVGTHEHREMIPIFENTQDIPELSAKVEQRLKSDLSVHGFLIRRHGLYTWGKNLPEAKRHVEVLEFLLEAIGRSRSGV
jgi:methylthioribulose-1-phosphate dehydratase